MQYWKHSSTLLVGGMLAFAVPIMAQAPGQQQQPQGQNRPAAGTPSHSAASANQRAADLLNTINKGEINVAQMMQGHTQNQQVKDFADTLVNDHKDAQNKLESAASSANISLKENPAMQKSDQKLQDRLSNEKGAMADQAFVSSQVRDHRAAIRQLQRLEPRVTDPQLKDVVRSTIPVLQKHLDDAQKLQTQLKAGKGGGGK
ncbi:MAG: DUF4142 domain-containing protein [Terriglobales bacterium]